MKRYSPAEVWAEGKTVITAHSGCEKTAPNSREHILAAIASGAEIIVVPELAFDINEIASRINRSRAHARIHARVRVYIM